MTTLALSDLHVERKPFFVRRAGTGIPRQYVLAPRLQTWVTAEAAEPRLTVFSSSLARKVRKRVMAKKPSTPGAMDATPARDQTKRRDPKALITIRLTELLAVAKRMVDNSTCEQAIGFNTKRWLDQWLERAQPALGGARRIDLLATQAGTQAVHQLLSAIESGAYT